jgi:hypothetical protein
MTQYSTYPSMGAANDEAAKGSTAEADPPIAK